MRIEVYFERTRKVIDTCPILLSSNIAYDKRGTYEGYIRGELYFVDNSVLHVREYVDVEIEIDRLMYVYHYMDASSTLVFRYDNTGHHQKLNLSSYPHHKHDREEDNVIASSAPDLATILSEIEELVELP